MEFPVWWECGVALVCGKWTDHYRTVYNYSKTVTFSIWGSRTCVIVVGEKLRAKYPVIHKDPPKLYPRWFNCLIVTHTQVLSVEYRHSTRKFKINYEILSMMAVFCLLFFRVTSRNCKWQPLRSFNNLQSTLAVTLLNLNVAVDDSKTSGNI